MRPDGRAMVAARSTNIACQVAIPVKRRVAREVEAPQRGVERLRGAARVRDPRRVPHDGVEASATGDVFEFERRADEGVPLAERHRRRASGVLRRPPRATARGARAPPRSRRGRRRARTATPPRDARRGRLLASFRAPTQREFLRELTACLEEKGPRAHRRVAHPQRDDRVGITARRERRHEVPRTTASASARGV